MLEGCLEVFITALGKTIENINIGLPGKEPTSSRLTTAACNCLVITEAFLPWIWVLTFALKNLQEDFESIDDIARHNENLIQN